MKVKPDNEDLCKENSNEVNNLLDNKKNLQIYLKNNQM